MIRLHISYLSESISLPGFGRIIEKVDCVSVHGVFTLNSIAVELFEVSCTFYVNFSELASRFEDCAAIQKLSSEFVMIKLGVGRNLSEINFCIKTPTSAFNEHYNEFSCVTYFFFRTVIMTRQAVTSFLRMVHIIPGY